MFVIGQDDFVAGFEIHAGGDDVHSFRGVVDQGDFLWRSAKGLCRILPDHLLICVPTTPHVFGGKAVESAAEILCGVSHQFRGGSQRGVVEVVETRSKGELGFHQLPIVFRIVPSGQSARRCPGFGEERFRGQFRKQSSRGEAGKGGLQKRTTLDCFHQTTPFESQLLQKVVNIIFVVEKVRAHTDTAAPQGNDDLLNHQPLIEPFVRLFRTQGE